MLKTHVNWEHGNEKEKDKESDAVNTFKCDKCEFMAETEQSLKTHVNLKHGNENEKDEESDAGKTSNESFKCDKCELMADIKKSLKTHVDMKHGNEKLNWKCLLSTLVMCLKPKIIFWNR